ncbi:MAG: prolipoprotein diacylglyceryl transferase [Actinobacteria bacterium HGW-Actinobacteria-2]|nr:MAG: prolipoprotein diacylglyceryl transferase [Actinobacteria bacterium HGW-Actinobacteria-2]
MMALFIPSPSINSFSLGPVTIHIYALCLITGIIAAWIIGVNRWQRRGGTSESFETVLLWAIPIGIVGARFYHVMTHLGDYFGPGANQHWWAIWEGGIAIYGAIGFGALAAFLVARRHGLAFAALADSLAPGIAVGQALGRFGNWFNQELYGLPTDLPWGLEIDPAHRVPGYEQYATFHPTFAYESLWNLLVAGVLLWADRKFTLGRGKVFALYIALYGLGRSFTESLRTDYSYDVFGPIRFNAAVAMLICLAGVILLIWLIRFRPGRESNVDPSNVITEATKSVVVEESDGEVADIEAASGGTDDAGEAPQEKAAPAESSPSEP